MAEQKQPTMDEMLRQRHEDVRNDVAKAIQRGAVYSVPSDHLLHLADEVMTVIDAEFLRVAADIHLWAGQMSTQKARTAAMFAADRVCELVGIEPDRAIDEALRRAEHDGSEEQA